jgi:hypothetical protein
MAFFGLFSKEKKEDLDKGLDRSRTSFLGQAHPRHCGQEHRGR